MVTDLRSITGSAAGSWACVAGRPEVVPVGQARIASGVPISEGLELPRMASCRRRLSPVLSTRGYRACPESDGRKRIHETSGHRGGGDWSPTVECSDVTPLRDRVSSDRWVVWGAIAHTDVRIGVGCGVVRLHCVCSRVSDNKLTRSGFRMTIRSV